jgi:hypothetical protein
MDLLPAPDQEGIGASSLLQPSRHFMAAAIKRCRWLPCAPVDLSTEEQAAEGVPAVLALWSGDAQVAGRASGPGPHRERPASGPSAMPLPASQGAARCGARSRPPPPAPLPPPHPTPPHPTPPPAVGLHARRGRHRAAARHERDDGLHRQARGGAQRRLQRPAGAETRTPASRAGAWKGLRHSPGAPVLCSATISRRRRRRSRRPLASALQLAVKTAAGAAPCWGAGFCSPSLPARPAGPPPATPHAPRPPAHPPPHPRQRAWATASSPRPPRQRATSAFSRCSCPATRAPRGRTCRCRSPGRTAAASRCCRGGIRDPFRLSPSTVSLA